MLYCRSVLVSALLLFSSSSVVTAFTLSVPSSRSSSSSSTTSLKISSWGVDGPPHRRGETMVRRDNPETNVQAYLKEPQAVEARVNIDGTVMVSGLVGAKERTDQFLFDLLNHEESAFEFTKIIAFVDDVAFAKKRLLSRSARYTGLLDKLDFRQAATAGALPEASQLDEVKSWVVYLDDPATLLSKCQQVAMLAKSAPSVENVAVLLANSNELDASACQAAVDMFKGSDDDKLSYTIVAVGKLEDDKPEGKECYQFKEFGSADGVLPSKAVFSRDESYRMITELLQLECGKNQALSFAEVYNVNMTEYRLVKGLRQAGYARPQEIDHMIREGPEAYRAAIEAFKTENPDAAKGYTSDAWWLAEEFQSSRRKSSEREAEAEQAVKDERTKEIEAIAKEWAKREYFRQSMAGTLSQGVSGAAPMTEDMYLESVWERALFEGDLKYRQMKGEIIDPENELANFKARQNRKKQTMLKRAKTELAEILDADNLGGDDLTRALAGSDDDDDDKNE